jgi:hypothetical protein
MRRAFGRGGSPKRKFYNQRAMYAKTARPLALRGNEQHTAGDIGQALSEALDFGCRLGRHDAIGYRTALSRTGGVLTNLLFVTTSRTASDLDQRIFC